MNKIEIKNLKIGKKLGLCFFILLALSLCGNIYVLSNLKKAGNLSHDLFNGPYQLTNQSMAIRRDVVSIDQNLAYAILEEDPTVTDYRATIMRNFDSINDSIRILRGESVIDKKLIEDIENSIYSLKIGYEKINQLIELGKYEDAKEMILNLDEDYYKSYAKSGESALALYEQAQIVGVDFDKGVSQTVSKAWLISAVVTLFNILVGVAICIYITRKLKKPIEEIEIAANKMSEGDFDINIEYVSKDELGSLSDSMRQMSYKTKEIINDTVSILEEVSSGNFNVESKVEYIGIFNNIENSVNKITDDLSDTISQINISSEEVASASDQVSSGSQMLAQGATEQASAIEELSATIIEISEKINDTAKNAKKANSLTLNSASQVKDGNEQMKKMIKSMEDISFTSNEIERIIKTIDDIAFQTNILALNAAVEAARAGSEGKGFAVVADEVRNLAVRSAQAAKNTAILIENSIKAVNEGSKIVDNTAQSLQKIEEITKRTTILVDKIAKASDEQASAISQVTLGVEQISDVVQTNSATSEESAAASEELNGQAQMLKSLIDKFDLKDKNVHHKSINFNSNENDNFEMSESED